MVSSTVYGIEELLDRIYTLLVAFGYEVWMSHKGTLPVRSDRTAFENCLAAVDACDLFLGIVTGDYGSGRDGDGPSITHQEIRQAIALNKPRWLLTHSDVVFARRLLRELGFGTPEDRQRLTLKKGAKAVTDLRVIDLYEEAILGVQPLAERAGNWAQEFRGDADALLFATAQFSRFREVEEFLRENLSRREDVESDIDRRRGDQ
jgi:nucleoside 2-deoxyribosyltransferase